MERFSEPWHLPSQITLRPNHVLHHLDLGDLEPCKRSITTTTTTHRSCRFFLAPYLWCQSSALPHSHNPRSDSGLRPDHLVPRTVSHWASWITSSPPAPFRCLVWTSAGRLDHLVCSAKVHRVAALWLILSAAGALNKMIDDCVSQVHLWWEAAS